MVTVSSRTSAVNFFAYTVISYSTGTCGMFLGGFRSGSELRAHLGFLEIASSDSTRTVVEVPAKHDAPTKSTKWTSVCV